MMIISSLVPDRRRRVRRFVRVAAVFCVVGVSLAGCISFANIPLELRATDSSLRLPVYEEASASERMPKFSELTLRGTLDPGAVPADVTETGSTRRVKLPREGNTHYDALAVMDELVTRHTSEAKYYLRALCNRCL